MENPWFPENDRHSWWVFWSFLYVFRRLRTKLPVHFLDQSLFNAGEVSEPDLSWGLASKTELWIFSGHLYNTNSGIGTELTEADISLFALFANQSAVQKSQLAMTRNRGFRWYFFRWVPHEERVNSADFTNDNALSLKGSEKRPRLQPWRQMIWWSFKNHAKMVWCQFS